MKTIILPSSDRMKSWSVFTVVAAVTLVADQATKYLAVLYLMPVGRINLIPGWVALSYVENDGGAWNIFAGQWWVFIIAAACAVLIIPWLFYRHTRIQPWAPTMSVAFGLILGGALGNAFDRILRPGHRVVDMIDLVGNYWPVFNLADTGICVGVALVFICSWKSP